MAFGVTLGISGASGSEDGSGVGLIVDEEEEVMVVVVVVVVAVVVLLDVVHGIHEVESESGAGTTISTRLKSGLKQ